MDWDIPELKRWERSQSGWVNGRLKPAWLSGRHPEFYLRTDGTFLELFQEGREKPITRYSDAGAGQKAF